jgi:RNA exonuclease 1
LARVSIIDYDFNVLMDEFVMPQREILDYNTKWSGITEQILRGVNTTLADIQLRLREIIDSDTIIVGHSLENDLHALQVDVYC